MTYGTPESPSISIIQSKGFKPVGISILALEEVFIFETGEEALKAYNQLERDEDGGDIMEVMGWWYGREEFYKYYEDYQKEFEYSPKIYWIKE